MEKKELICIGCPLGCPLSVILENDTVTSVSGNTCLRGDTYARKEVTNPTRIITSTIPVYGGVYATVSCKTESDIPKDKIFAIIKELKNISVNAPVCIGDVLAENIADTGVNIIATKNIEQA
jgi:CxxC motif-containing protein